MVEVLGPAQVDLGLRPVHTGGERSCMCIKYCMVYVLRFLVLSAVPCPLCAIPHPYRRCVGL